MEIYNKKIDDAILNELVLDIKKKKGLKGMKDPLIIKEIAKLFATNTKLLNYFSSLDLYKNNLKQIKKSRRYKEAIKQIRDKFRLYYEMFLKDYEKRDEYLKEIDSLDNIKAHIKMLSTQKSTNERIPIYPILYNRIFEITGKPKSILDLGCGMNPFSYPFLRKAAGNECTYYASDFSEEECKIIERYFKKNKIKGVVFPLDLREIKDANILDIFPKTDVCFLFKVLDTIEKGGHKLAEMIINAVNSDYVVASFSTRTLTGKKMNHPYRGWIERMCKRIGYSYDIIEFENEIFYIIKKKSDFIKLFKSRS